VHLTAFRDESRFHPNVVPVCPHPRIETSMGLPPHP
jgi:hypothetical protein